MTDEREENSQKDEVKTLFIDIVHFHSKCTKLFFYRHLLVNSLENQRNNALLLLWWMIFHHAQWTISLPSQREMRMTVTEDVTAERPKMHSGKKTAALACKRIIN